LKRSLSQDAYAIRLRWWISTTGKGRVIRGRTRRRQERHRGGKAEDEGRCTDSRRQLSAGGKVKKAAGNMKTKFKGIAWLGVRTRQFDKLLDFYQNKMSLPVVHEASGFRALDLPNGDRIAIFSEEYRGEDGDDYKHFSTGPVVGFLVDDIEEAKVEMETEGIEFIGPIGEGGNIKWAHFRGVDGNTYELTQIRQAS
jgi:catechol 2,3-dioxygenase-like lactoylglutathione lyase family enzyme